MERKFVLRSQLQVDASPALKRELKKIALGEGRSLREVVILALIEKYPALEPYVKSELNGSLKS